MAKVQSARTSVAGRALFGSPGKASCRASEEAASAQCSSDLEIAVKDLLSDNFVVDFPAIGRISQLAPSASLLKSSGAGRRLRCLAELATTPMPAKVQIRAIFDSLVASVRRERHAKRVAADMLGNSGFSVVAGDSVSASCEPHAKRVAADMLGNSGFSVVAVDSDGASLQRGV
jgi:hypothetical protein